ncbi:MAG TPA: aminopeptidase P family protein [Acidimicrobiales bacterium]|jgi:Xaa-Pro aminopeptidase|nr:aminopeptidase P family protein [Acidimicrobiales bacterium]
MTTTARARANPYVPPAATLPPITVVGRLDRLREAFDGHEIDALVVTTLANVRYLTGFAGSAGVLTVTRNGALLTTDGRYRTQSSEQVERSGAAPQVEIVIGPVAEQRKAAQELLDPSIVRIGLEADNVSWSGQRTWADLLDGDRLVPTSNAVEALRERKDEAEIARMERAAAIADAALFDTLPLMGQGVTEEHFALELDTAMRRHGAESTAFETIVASGENSAKPHHHPGGRRINQGDPVVVDFGATFEGYRSDMTRTFCVDTDPEGELARIFEVVQTSQAAGAAAVRPGISVKEVDDVCRDIIRDAGWAERFEHGTGHGVGLDIHEAPTVSQLGTAILAPGFVVTVEPGVYVPGHGGVRVEDTLVVTADGARALTRFTKDIHGSLD